MFPRTLAALSMAAFIWAGQAHAQAPIAALQFVNARQGATVDLLFDDHAVATNFTYRATTGQLHTLYGTHHVAVVDGADTVTAPIRLTTGLEYHVFVVPAGLLVKEDVRAAASAGGMTEMYLVNLANLTANVRVLDALRDNAVLDTLAMGTAHGETTGYISVRTSEWNFEITSPDTMLHETFYLDAMVNFNLSQWPLVLVLDNAASGQGLKLSVLSGRHQLLFEDLAVSTRAGTAPDEVPQTFTLRGNYPNPFNPSTTIVIELTEPSHVSVALHDLLGREVLALPARAMGPGQQAIAIDAGALPSGLYVYRVSAHGERGPPVVRSGQMTLLK